MLCASMKAGPLTEAHNSCHFFPFHSMFNDPAMLSNSPEKEVYTQASLLYNTSSAMYPVCSMTPDVGLWHQLQHYFSLKTRLSISQKEAQFKMAEDISSMKVTVDVIRRPTFSNQSLLWDYVIMQWTETFNISSAIPGGIVTQYVD